VLAPVSFVLRGNRSDLKIVLCLLALLFPTPALSQERKVDLELVFAADISGSMDHEEAVLQRSGFINAIRHPEVLATIQRGRYGRIAVTYVEWAGELFQTTLVGWTEVSNGENAEAFARAIAKPPVRTAYWTSISTVTDYARESFKNNGFSAPRQVIDISGDGPNNSGDYAPSARDRATNNGITINGLPIINNRPGPYGFMPMPNLDLYYEDCVIGGFGAFVIVANGFQDFARAVRRKMVLEIAGTLPAHPLLHLASERYRPPCDAGEVQLRRYRDLDPMLP
jgi:hypothetical protein